MMRRYFDNNLLKEEKILFRTRKHVIIFLMPIFWTLIYLFFWLNPNEYIHMIAFIPAILMFLSWGNEGLNYMTSDFVVTNKRILMKEGFFFRHINETRLSTIANVTVNQSLLGQLLDYGTVWINTFGGESDPFMQISHPNLFKKSLQQQLDSLTR